MEAVSSVPIATLLLKTVSSLRRVPRGSAPATTSPDRWGGRLRPEERFEFMSRDSAATILLANSVAGYFGSSFSINPRQP